MKKLLSILLSVVIVATCFTGASGAVEAQGGETSGNQTIESAVSTSALPVVPSDKEFIQNETTYCNPISLTQGSGECREAVSLLSKYLMVTTIYL